MHLKKRYLNLVPFRDTINDFRHLNPRESREVFNFLSNVLGNIFLFIPFSIILFSVFNVKNSNSVLLSAFLLSVSIEMLQYLFRIGVADIDDVLLNTLGAGIGILIYKIYKNML
jgi:glycopeptide antibiotics resistance protein